MKKLTKLLCGVATAMLLAVPTKVQPQTTFFAFGCLANGSCPGGSLESYSTSAMTQGYIVSVGGYYQAGDSGDGNYVVLGQQPSVCNGYSSWPGKGQPTATKISFSSPYYPTGLTVGELVSGSGSDTTGTVAVQAGSEIASITYNISGDLNQITLTLTLTLPLSGTATDAAPITLAISGSNGGTLILDNYSEPDEHNCYQKTNCRGDPHEFGAYGDGQTNDTTSILNWLGAYGNAVVAGPGASLNPSNFGPWIATVPATYVVYQPLVCPPNAVLVGPANNTAASSSGATAGSPAVTISAVSPTIGVFQGTANQPLPALMMASDYCRISGIALDTNGNGVFYASNNMSTTSGGHPSVTLGNTPACFIVPGTPVSDTLNCIPLGDTVLSLVGYTLTLSVNASATCDSDTIITTGFYTLDVVGTHVAVDSYSLLRNGFWNIYCGSVYEQGLDVKDSQIVKSYDDGIHIPDCDNVRLTGDNLQIAGTDLGGTGVSGVNGAGIYFGGNDLTLADGIVQQANGPGVLLSGAKHVGITSMIFNTNGQYVPATSYSPNIDIEPPPGTNGVYSTQDTTICNNRIDAAANGAANSAQIRLGGTIDNLNLCGNTYESGGGSNNTNITPWYVYDIVSAATLDLTNTHFYETPEQPSVSVFSPAAQPLLQPLQVPQFTQNQLSGLTLSNSSPPSQQIVVAPGSTADSTNSTLIQLTAPCTVNLSGNGAGGLDVGTVHANTTYFIFVIAPAASSSILPNGPMPSCIASQSLQLEFTKASFDGTGYMISATGGTLVSTTTVYNANSLNNTNQLPGVAIGNEVWDTMDLPTGVTTITGFSANAGPSSPSGTWTGVGTDTVITLCGSCSTSGVQEGMAIQEQTSNGCIPANAYVTAFTSGIGGTVTVSNIPMGCNSATDTNLSISGARQLILSNNATDTNPQADFRIATAYYRMVGALYTNSSSDFVQFTQNGDTFYLATPAASDYSVSLTPNSIVLGAVPNGISVKAFGRCVGGVSTGGPNYVILFSPGQNSIPFPAKLFTASPGFDVNSLTPNTAFPFSAWTGTAQTLMAEASAASTLQCMTDGWEWPGPQ